MEDRLLNKICKKQQLQLEEMEHKVNMNICTTCSFYRHKRRGVPVKQFPPVHLQNQSLTWNHPPDLLE